MKPKEDARVSKSKNALIDSFFSLLRNKSFDSITINEICDNANVTRATFYKHFNDKMSFLAFYFSRMKEKFDDLFIKKTAPLGTFDYNILYAKELINYLAEKEDIIMKILESKSKLEIIEIVITQSRVDILNQLKMNVDKGEQYMASIEVIAAMTTGAVTHAMLNWIENGKQIPRDQLTEEITTILMAIQGKFNPNDSHKVESHAFE